MTRTLAWGTIWMVLITRMSRNRTSAPTMITPAMLPPVCGAVPFRTAARRACGADRRDSTTGSLELTAAASWPRYHRLQLHTSGPKLCGELGPERALLADDPGAQIVEQRQEVVVC